MTSNHITFIVSEPHLFFLPARVQTHFIPSGTKLAQEYLDNCFLQEASNSPTNRWAKAHALRHSQGKSEPCVQKDPTGRVRHMRFQNAHGSVSNVHTALLSVQERNAHTHSAARYNHINSQHHAPPHSITHHTNTSHTHHTLSLSLRSER